MAEAIRDQNHITTGTAISSVDSITTLNLKVDPVTNYLLADITIEALIATSASMDKRDQNHTPTVYGISSVDGITLVPIRTNSTGALLVDIL